MQKVWSEMRLSPGQYVTDIRPAGLTVDQQGRLALGWPGVWMSGRAAEAGAEDWRIALGYSRIEWNELSGVYADVLERGGVWLLPFMRDELARQRAVSDLQASKGRRSASVRATEVNHGQPESATVESGQPQSTTVNLASASASESEPISAPPVPRVTESRNGKGSLPPTFPEGFTRFWDAYACPRRTGKPACIILWKSLKCEKIADSVLAELERFKASPQWRDGFMPEPSRWLKKAPWVDGPTAPAGGDQW